MKSKSGAKKRFKVRKSGSIKRGQQGHRHILSKKTPKRKMHLRKGTSVSKVDQKTVASMIQG